MLLVLHGAVKNVGDFLIRDRGVALLRHVLGDVDLQLVDRRQPLDPEAAEAARGIVLDGGPGLTAEFHPGTFPLVPDLRELRTPILPLALGWSGKPDGDIDRFRFSDASLEALRAIHERIGWSSVRDDLTLEVVQRAEVGEARRTGCNAWYHLPSLGTPFVPPEKVGSAVFTTPANLRHGPEAIRVMRLLARRYPGADRVCVFHRGIAHDPYTSRKTAAANRVMQAAAMASGYRIVDAAYDLSSIDFYGGCDLHVGYRVHAHLAFLSQRRPSLLVSEDGRGLGQSRTLHDPYGLRAGGDGLLGALDEALRTEEANRFAATAVAVDEIERSWPVMRETIEQLR